jgi:hypothetical protein
VQLLASEVVASWPQGPVRPAVGLIVLGPHAAIAPSTETALIAGDDGELAADGQTFSAGMGLLRPVSPAGGLRNGGAGLLVLLVVTVAPIPA